MLVARIAALEAQLGAPPKTPDNSSTPPSSGQKPNLPERPKKPRHGRPGVTRALAEHPDRVIDATLAACPHCTHPLSAADQSDIHAYDHIDLPPIRPVITRINRHRGVCPCCRKRVATAAPDGFEPGSPFGPGLCALIIHLHVTQAIGFERLVRLMAEVFGSGRAAWCSASFSSRSSRRSSSGAISASRRSEDRPYCWRRSAASCGQLRPAAPGGARSRPRPCRAGRAPRPARAAGRRSRPRACDRPSPHRQSTRGRPVVQRQIPA